MTASNPIGRFLLRYPSLSGLAYGAVVLVLCIIIVFLLVQISERYQAQNTSLETLARLEARTQHSSEPDRIAVTWPPGSPFLEGQTVTVASAMLLQRVTGAITQAGGAVVTTEVESQGAQSKDGYLRVIATCELEQVALQQVLHDVEVGMPFLFVDQLLVQTQSEPSDGGRLRVRLGVSGLWPGAK